MADQALVSVRSLSKRYFVRETVIDALDNVSLDVRRGETLAIVGESGSGKTTLGNLILGLENPASGQILYNSEALTGRRPLALRKEIQLVQQNPMSALNPRRTIGHAIEMPMVVHRLGDSSQRKNKIGELLEVVGLSADFMTRYPSSLSGGQRQRVALARALATEPNLLVLDEPTSALDVSVQAKVLKLLVDLQRMLKLTYLFITHDLAVVRCVATRVAVMYRGRLVETGPVGEVFARPKHRYTNMLLSSVPVMTGEDEATKPHWDWQWQSDSDDPEGIQGCTFAQRCMFAVDACRTKPPPFEGDSSGHEYACVNPRH